MRAVGSRESRMCARRVGEILSPPRFEHPPREVFTSSDLIRQDAMRIMEFQRLRFRIEEADRRTCSEGRAGAVLQRADDRWRVRQAREARRAAQKGAQLGLLPRAA